MDKYPEIEAYLADNSIDYILEEFRNNCKKGSCLKTALARMYSELAYYTIPFRANHDMSLLALICDETSKQIMNNEISLYRFDHLVYAIFENKNERFILDLSIEIHHYEMKRSPLPTPTNSIKSYVQRYTEIMHFDKVAENLKDDLKSDLDDHVFHSIPNFWNFFFINKRWSKQTARIWERYQKYENAEMKRRSSELEKLENPYEIRRLEYSHKTMKEKFLLKNMKESEVWEWLDFFKESFLDQLQGPLPRPSTEHPTDIDEEGFPLRGQYCRTGIMIRAVDSASFNETDFMIKSIDLPAYGPIDGKDINVLGELDKSPMGNVRQEKFIRLSRSVREVFRAQPLRRFMHGFCLFREEFELWLFDRSGAYGSGLLSIVDDKEILIRVLSSYVLMNNEELGCDMSVLQKGDDKFVHFPQNGNIESQSFEIKSKPAVQPMGLFSRGTTCYDTKDEKIVIKYSWSNSEKDTEVELLNIASSVPGVVNCLTSELVYETKCHLDGLDLYRATLWKISASNKYIPKETDTIPTIKLSLERNHRLTRIALTPRGRPIYSSGSILDFVAGIRDAIKGHEGLVGKGILHGDISEGNIILLKPTTEYDLYGMLIDLDRSAKMEGNKALDDDRFFIGTRKFMALERLKYAYDRGRSIQRTCRHDLESFFYVFIVGCTEYERVHKSTRCKTTSWCTNNVRNDITSKTVDLMDLRILKNFTPSFEKLKELARKIRIILFGHNGRYIETPEDCGPLYRRMIKAFDETVEAIRDGRIENKIFKARRR